MKFIKLHLIVILVLGISMQSCKKKGCTDRSATNYNSLVKEDDGSCLYVDHTLFVVGNYNGIKQTFSHVIFDTAIYHSYPASFTIQKAGLFDTVLFDGYRLAYFPTDSESKYISFYIDLHPFKDIEYARIEYFPKLDSLFYEHFKGELAESSGTSYFGKKQ
ncbi:MAG: hypothetical protein WCI97_00530 [Bacteroidota bacterium]